jgi:ribonuclease HII
VITVGIDEVGRGCWAGPVVAGAVILGRPIPGLADSKKLSAKTRERLSREVHLLASAVGIGWVAAVEVDAIGLTAAVGLAMQRALQQINKEYDEIIIDGSYNFFPDNALAKTLVRADDLIPAVSAASIVAKVARDAYMCAAAKDFPDYGFDKHVGYGTALHLAALRKHGVTVLHRMSYKPVAAVHATIRE